MFKQVFGKFFGNTTTTNNNNSLTISNSNGGIGNINSSMTNNNRAPIYSIPSISSSCFQQQSSIGSVPPCLSSYNDENQNNINNQNISPSSSSSFSSNSIQQQSKSTTNVKTSSFLGTLKFSSMNKFSDTSTRQIYIAPHCIKYTNSTLDDTIYRIDDESLNEIAVEILESDNMPPKLQIVYHSGSYYSINNSHLQIYKQLQLSGLITHVQADVISVEAIPVALRDHLLQPIQSNSSSNDSNEISGDEDYEDDCDLTDPAKLINMGQAANVGLADVISPSCIEMLSKEMMIDETYEFGACENCVDSDGEQQNEKMVLAASTAGTSSQSQSTSRHPNYQRKQLHLKKLDQNNVQISSSSGCSSNSNNSSRNESRTDYEDDEDEDDDDDDDDEDVNEDEDEDDDSLDDDEDIENEESDDGDYLEQNEKPNVVNNNSSKINMLALSSK